MFSLWKKRRITTFDITLFFRQFATLLTAGVPLLHGCDLLEKSQEKKAMQDLIHSIKHELLSGKDFYFSLIYHEQYFDPLTCQLIKIGEHTGKLDTTLQTIADEKEKQHFFKKQIKQTLFYPCIISISAFVITISLFLFVIPRFAELFADSHIALPTLTVWLFFLSAKLNQYWILLFLPFIPIVLIFIPHPSLQMLKDILLHRINKLPLIRSFLQKILLARFARNLAITFAAGIPIMDSLTLLTQPPREFSHAIMHLRNHIHSGLQLHQAMQSSSYFPDLMVQMVKIGEESGSLDALLLNVARWFESDIHHLIRQFCELLEPLIMLVLGVLIGGLIIGMYLPIFKLGSVL